MQLSKHFALEEFLVSEIAERKNIPNLPTGEQIENLKELASVLEQVREVLETPIIITSGFRSAKLNSAIGGHPKSHHVEGWAADFISPAFGTPRQICVEIAAAQLPFDQLIEEGSWVHLSVHPQMRGQVLTARFANGKATYLSGLA